MTRKARVEGAIADPVPGDNGAALQRIVDFFKAEHPDAWEAARLGPLEYGLDTMIKALND